MSGTTILLIVFRALHILGGVAWVGGVLFMARFLFSSVAALGPAGGDLMDHLMRQRRLPVYLMGVAMTTVLSGLLLYWHDTKVSGSAWPTRGSGLVFGIGGALAIIGVIIGMSVNSPSARRIAVIIGGAKAARRPPSAEEVAEITRLQGRLTISSKVVTVLVVLATLAMAIARYVP